MTRRTTSTLSRSEQLETDVLDSVGSAPTESQRTGLARRLPPAAVRRPALYLAVAAAGALVVNVLTGGEPPARAEAQTESVSIAQQLGISQDAGAAAARKDSVGSLKELVASRSERQAEQTAAAKAQGAADKAERDRRAAAAAAKKAAEEAARKKAAEAAAAKKAAENEAARKAAAKAAAKAPAPAAAPAPAPASSGSFQGYALSKLGGDGGQFSCLENLWGKESGWNPNAQNPSSTAYGIPQFLDSTWASTGIAKTSDGYRQIDAGLIYIDSRYGSPCGAWGHSQSTGWY
jgi:Transglycosylase SLT domain